MNQMYVDMEKNRYYIIRLYLLALCFFPFVISCEEEALEDDVPDQLFRPVLFTAEINVDEVTFTWVPIENASYVIEVSKDDLFTNDLQSYAVDGTVEYTVENLLTNTRYSARIKAVSKDERIKDSGYTKITFLTGI